LEGRYSPSKDKSALAASSKSPLYFSNDDTARLLLSSRRNSDYITPYYPYISEFSYFQSSYAFLKCWESGADKHNGKAIDGLGLRSGKERVSSIPNIEVGCRVLELQPVSSRTEEIQARIYD
jgi:hypothetical protein